MTLKLILALTVLTLVAVGVYHTNKALPEGLSYRGDIRPLHGATLLTDLTYHHQDGSETRHHEIFDEAFRMIGQAQQFILIDMFLYNSTRPEGVPHRPLAKELSQALIESKRARPSLSITVISDPLNTMYGGTSSPWFEALRAEGITVIETNLLPMRDSNPAWSSMWRICCRWSGNNSSAGWLGNALGSQPVTLRSYLALLNFKANHRKLLVVDEQDSLRALVTSANPHDGSSRHSNVGLSFQGAAARDVLHSELAVMAMSGAETSAFEQWLDTPNEPSETVTEESRFGEISILTESAIRDRILNMISDAKKGDHLDLAVFYLSHRTTIEALLNAVSRGVKIRVLLDANNEAFGHQKSGIPNRQAAMELHHAGVPVRWCNTLGEQCHSKLLMLRPARGAPQLLLGSANFTRRNLDDLNLETSVWLSVPQESAIVQKAVAFFDQQWRHGPDQDPVMSQPYDTWADESRFRYWRYRIMEFTGLSTF